jgi:hypothetical protein
MQALLDTHCKATLTQLTTRRVQQSQLQELRGHQPFCVQEAVDRWLHTHALQNPQQISDSAHSVAMDHDLILFATSLAVWHSVL